MTVYQDSVEFFGKILGVQERFTCLSIVCFEYTPINFLECVTFHFSQSHQGINRTKVN